MMFVFVYNRNLCLQGFLLEVRWFLFEMYVYSLFLVYFLCGNCQFGIWFLLGFCVLEYSYLGFGKVI